MNGITPDMVGSHSKRKGNPVAAKKKPSAAQLRARKLFAERARAGTLRKGNPLTRVKIKSPPQRPAGNKSAPSKRLIKRRTRTVKAPTGYYANPSPLHGLKYAVLCDNKIIAAFVGRPPAVQYGDMLAQGHEDHDFKVVKVA